MKPEPTIRVKVDVTNPGQFFACCGLLELADRLWKGAEGWFDESLTKFSIASIDRNGSANEFLAELSSCELKNTIPLPLLQRFEALKSQPLKNLSNSEKSEKKELEKLMRELPLLFGAPFNITIDWFRDNLAGGSRFKTWAGQQSVLAIAEQMFEPVQNGTYSDVPVENWLIHPTSFGVDFNFDAQSSVQASALDVGFVLDPLRMGSNSCALTQLLAFIGLQRFRATADSANNAYCYATWTIPLLPTAAASLASSAAKIPGQKTFTFPLLYRTKYLKSFLPATLLNKD